MKYILGKLNRFWRDEAGASAVEYGLIIALIALIMSAGALVAGNGLSGLFNYIGTQAGTVWGS